VLRLATQDLLDQVVDDISGVTRERLDEGARIVPALDGEGRQLEAGDPSLGAGSQSLDIVRGEFQAHRLDEERGRLVGGEAQVGCPQLDHPSPGAQASEGESGILAGRDDEVELRRQVIDQKRQGIVDVVRVDEVIVVQHQNDRLGQDGDGVEQGGQARLHRRRLGGGGRGVVGEPWRDGPERGDEVGEEACGVAVGLLQREPGDRAAAAGDPAAHERGLAESGGRGDQRQGTVQPGIQSGHEAGPGDRARTGRREEELGDQDLSGHGLNSTPGSAMVGAGDVLAPARVMGVRAQYTSGPKRSRGPGWAGARGERAGDPLDSTIC